MRAPLPQIKQPMAATQVARPFHHAGWVYEEKVDGWRVLAYKDAAGVRLVSRNARDLTRRFPELVTAVSALEPPTLILDAEIAVFDRQLLSRFEWLRGRAKDEPAPPPHAMTMGIVLAARLAASVAGAPAVTIVSTLRATSSAAMGARCPLLPSAQRYSMAMFRPSALQRSRGRAGPA
jgi:hypothetical protein